MRKVRNEIFWFAEVPLAIFPSRASSQEEALKPHLFTARSAPLGPARTHRKTCSWGKAAIFPVGAAVSSSERDLPSWQWSKMAELMPSMAVQSGIRGRPVDTQRSSANCRLRSPP